MTIGHRIALALMLAALALVAPPAQAATKITFLYTPVNSWIGIFVAKDQGLLEKHGLDITLTIAQNGSVIAAALVADSAQIGGPTPTVMLQANEQGLDLVVIAGTATYPLNNLSGIIARKDSTIKATADLVGKKVGVPGLGGLIDVLAKKLVQAKGIDYHRVDWIELTLGQMGDGLKSGIADAVAVTDPFYSRIMDSGIGINVGDYGSVIPAGTVPIVYTSTRTWATKNAAAVAALRAALKEAEIFIRDPANLSTTRAILAKYTMLPPQAAATLSIPERLDVDPQPKSLQFWIEVSREQGLIKGNPDPASLIAP